jgi:hypothetical protein
MKMYALFLVFLFNTLSFGQQQTGSGGGGNGGPNPTDELPESIFLQIQNEEDFNRLKDKYTHRAKRLDLVPLNLEDLLKVKKLISFFSELQKVDAFCAKESSYEKVINKSSSIDSIAKDFHITFLKLNLEADSIQPKKECDCDQLKAYHKCLKSNQNDSFLNDYVKMPSSDRRHLHRFIQIINNKSRYKIDKDFEIFDHFMLYEMQKSQSDE